MNELMRLAHEFLQNFCWGNPSNQVLLHKHTELFLTPGVSALKLCIPARAHVRATETTNYDYILRMIAYAVTDHIEYSVLMAESSECGFESWS